VDGVAGGIEMSDKERCITDDLSDVDTAELTASLPSFFSVFGDYETTSFLNWRFDDCTSIYRHFFVMGNGYFEATIALIDNCIEDNLRRAERNILVFPILFNLVHGIELYLKGINSLLQTFLKLTEDWEWEDYQIEGNHDIKQLCQKSVSLIKKIDNKDLLDGLIDEFKFVQRFIELLYAETNDMTFARYPIDNKKKAGHFYTQSNDNVPVSLRVLRQWVLRLHQILDNMDYFDYQNDEILETLALNREWGMHP